MKALSIQQPWAEAILSGVKAVENRRWGTHYRGPLIVHAGQTYDHQGAAWMAEHRPRFAAVAGSGGRGAFLGVVELLHVWPPGEGPLDPWRDRRQFGWKLGRVAMFARPLPGRGQLSLFDPPAPVLAAARAAWEGGGEDPGRFGLLLGV